LISKDGDSVTTYGEPWNMNWQSIGRSAPAQGRSPSCCVYVAV